ncbi:MAG: DUF2157 domain-containing protein [Hyphomicrobium sp.]
MWSHKKRVERDLSRWREAGWVTVDGETAIRADLARTRGFNLATVLSMLAAVLLAFAVMSFVGANWQDMSKLLRIALLFTLLVGSTIAAGVFFERGLDGFGHACAMLGSAIFGANIMLISQMYHMDGNAPDAVLLWAGGALLSGLLLRSGPTLALAMVLVCFWAGWETNQRDEVFWPFLAAWAVVSAGFYWLKWRPGLHFAGWALAGFLITFGYIWRGGHQHWTTAAIGLALSAAFIAGDKWRPDLSGLWQAALPYALVILFWAMMALQYNENPTRTEFIGLALLTLALTVSAIWWGLTSNSRTLLWLGYIGFSTEIMSVYQKTVGSLIGTSLFFLVAGVLVALLAFMAYRLNARQHAKEMVS